MLLESTLYSLASLLIASSIYIVRLLWNNYQSFKFFENHGSEIPVLPEPSIFSGHVLHCYLHPRNWKVMADLHDKYGPTYGWFYFDKPAVSTTDLDFIKTINFDEKDDHLNRIDLNVPVRELFDDSVAFAKLDQWHRLRKAMAPAFSSHKIKQPNVQQELTEIVGRLVDSLERKLAQAQQEFIIEDVDDVFHRYALAVVFKSFYKQDKVIDMDGKVDKWASMIRITLKNYDDPMLRISMTFPVLKPMMNWMLKNFTYQGVMRRQIMGFIKAQTHINLMARQQLANIKSKSTGEKVDEDNFILQDGSHFRRNMIDYITDQYHNKKISLKEYSNSSFFLFFAANKTSAETVSKFIFNLAQYPAVQLKLRESVLEHGIESEYLTWTLNESMRLFPPAPVGSQRTITRDVETKAGLVPAGTHVFTTLNAIHRLPEVWGDDANQFKPERWAHSKSFHPCQFMPFGVGRRNCFGKEFAIQSIRMVSVELIRRFKFEAISNFEDAQSYFSPGLIFCVAEKPLNVKISRWEP